MNRFEGQTALITGAARGIGRGVALCLAREGANIVINDRTHDDLAEDLVNEITSLGPDALFFKADVSNRNEVGELFAAAEDRFDRIDVVVSNAYRSVRQPVLQAKWEDVLATLEVTQFGAFHVCQRAAQHMVKQEPNPESRGKIILISSVQAEVAADASAAYNMAKAGIEHFSHTLALEMSKHRINVNVVRPGWIDQPGERAFYSEDEIHEAGKLLPWGRLGAAEEIGKGVAYLASSDADYVTGTTLCIDGGYLVSRSTVD